MLAQDDRGATLLLSFPGQEPHTVAFERVGLRPLFLCLGVVSIYD